MAYALIGTGVSAGSSNNGFSVTTGAYDTTGATLLVLVLSDFFPVTLSAITDNKSNGWTALTSSGVVANGRVTIFYSVPVSVGTGHTFTATRIGTNTSFPSIAVMAFSGASATPADLESGATAAAATSVQPGSITPSADNALVIAGVTFDVTNTIAVDSDFLGLLQVDHLTNQHFGVAMAYKIQTTAAAVNPTFSWASAADAASRQASFLAAAAGGGGGAPRKSRRALMGVG